jgi:hypothetical protein
MPGQPDDVRERAVKMVAERDSRFPPVTDERKTDDEGMAYQIRAIEPDVLNELRVSDDAGREPRPIVDDHGGSPLRCCLRRSVPTPPPRRCCWKPYSTTRMSRWCMCARWSSVASNSRFAAHKAPAESLHPRPWIRRSREHVAWSSNHRVVVWGGRRGLNHIGLDDLQSRREMRRIAANTWGSRPGGRSRQV